VDPAPRRKLRWLLIVPVALGVMIANVAVHILYMVIYSYLINPGHDVAFYEAHAKVSAPYSSIVAGMPLVFLGCRWIAKKFAPESSITAALVVWLVYFVIDLAVIVSAGAFAGIAVLFAISMSTKFAAAYFGGLAARKQFAAGV
jgi:hypothetical protein